MPRIEMLPEGYGIHPDDFDKGEVRYYIIDYVGVEIMVVHSIMFSKELVPYLTGSRQEIELSPKVKFIARIYVED